MNKNVTFPEDGSKIKAISANVFVKRDDTETQSHGIHVSERAQVGSMNGEIIAIDEKCGFAKTGDRVHVPHYGVQDVEHDGQEYALFKSERLFAVEHDGEYHPINRYVMVRKCENDHIRDESGEIALYMTENHIETTNWVEVIEVATDCDHMKEEYVGLFCVAPENDERLARIGNTKDFCLHEDLIKFLTDGG